MDFWLPETKTFDWFDEQKATLVRELDGGVLLPPTRDFSLILPQSAVNYNSSAGSVGKNFYSNSLLRASQNTFFTSSQRGIEYFKYVEGQADFVDSKVVLTGFNKMGEAVRLDKPLSYITDLYLSYEDYFSLRFRLLDSDPKRSHFAYNEGYDEQKSQQCVVY